MPILPRSLRSATNSEPSSVTRATDEFPGRRSSRILTAVDRFVRQDDRDQSPWRNPMTHSASTADAALTLSPRAKLEMRGVILLAMFLSALVQTVVGVALPKIVSSLHVSNEL